MTTSSNRDQSKLTKEMQNRIANAIRWSQPKKESTPLPEEQRFKPRDWQGAALIRYSDSAEKNYTIVACPASGKTTAMIMCARHSIEIGEASFMIVLVTNSHLQKSFVEDAMKMNVGLYPYSHPHVKILNRKEVASPGSPAGTAFTSLEKMVKAGIHGLVMPVHLLASDRHWDDLRSQISRLQNGVVLCVDEIHHYGDRLEKKEKDATPAFTKGTLKVFTDDITSRRILGTGTPFRSDPRAILSKWVEYVDAEIEQEQPNGKTKTVAGKQMAVMKEGHTYGDICERSVAVINQHGVVVSYGEHAVPMGWCPEVLFNLDDYKHNWEDVLVDEVLPDGSNPTVPYRDITWAMCDAAKEERPKLLVGCKLDAVKPTNGFVRDRIRKIDDIITRDRGKGFNPRPESACLVVVPGGGPSDNPDSDSDEGSFYSSMPSQYCDVIKQETGENAWIIVGDMSKCRAGHIAKPLGKTINGVTIQQPSDLIKAFSASTDRYVITQKMIAEGATILRLDHVFYCGTDLTEMFLWQVLGRVLRMYGIEKVAYFWSYNHPVIRVWAKKIKESLDKLKKEEKEPKDGPEPPDRIKRIFHNCSHDSDYEIYDGEEFQGERLAVIKFWLAQTQSSLSIGEAEKHLKDNGYWEHVCRQYQDAPKAEGGDACGCVVNAVLPARFGGNWRGLSIGTRITVLKEIMRRIYITRYWKDEFGDADYSEISKDNEARERVFKRASAAYRRRFQTVQQMAELQGEPLDEALYVVVQESVKALKSEHGICHTTLNYQFPANA